MARYNIISQFQDGLATFILDSLATIAYTDGCGNRVMLFDDPNPVSIGDYVNLTVSPRLLKLNSFGDTHRSVDVFFDYDKDSYLLRLNIEMEPQYRFDQYVKYGRDTADLAEQILRISRQREQFN